MCELDADAATYYDRATHTEAVLDRAFTTLPSWLLRVSNVSGHVKKTPYAMSQEQISDHALITWSI
eukprot:731871-Karenia_brevis.AAC.1